MEYRLDRGWIYLLCFLVGIGCGLAIYPIVYPQVISFFPEHMPAEPATIECVGASDCGVSQYTGGFYCRGDSITRDFANISCINPNTTSSQCLNVTEKVMLVPCPKNTLCREGECVILSCTNGEWDLGEVGVDCGGQCGACHDNIVAKPVYPECKGIVNYTQPVVDARLYERENGSSDAGVKVTYSNVIGGDSRFYMFYLVGSFDSIICGLKPRIVGDTITARLPYDTAVRELVVTRENNIIVRQKVVGCNRNGVCEKSIGETFESCTLDCSNQGE